MTLLEQLFNELESGAVRIAPEVKAKYLIREREMICENDKLGEEGVITPSAIVNLVAHVSNVSVSDIRSADRHRTLVVCRHIVCYFARRYTNASLHEIGAHVNRDHSTVIKSVKVVENMIEYGLDWEKNLIKKIENYLKTPH
jgi:chromosomal replication initiation ATPase DnaA